MAIKATFRGIEYTFSNVAEAVAFGREVSGDIAAPKVEPKGRDDRTLAAMVDTLKFLDAINVSEGPGATSAAVAAALALADEKGIGSKLTVIKKTLKSLGLEPQMVFDRVRLADGSRYWRPREAYVGASEAVRRRVTGG